MRMFKFVIFVLLFLPFVSFAQVKDTIIHGNPYIIHSVEFRETLYGISREYNAELNDIVVNNPFVINGLQIGQKLLIPVSKSFAKNFSVKIKDKEKLKQNEIEVEKTIYELKKVTDVVSVNDSLINSDSEVIVESDSSLNVSLLLPFYLDLNDSLNIDSELSIYSKSKIAIDYYFGVLLALDTLSKLGVNIDFNTYDIPNDSTFESLLLNNTFDKSNLIIGPLYISQFSLLAEFYKDDISKRLVSPLSFKNIDPKYKNTFQLVPSSNIQLTKAVDYINRNYNSSNFVLIGLESEIENINCLTREVKMKRVQKNTLPKPKVLMFESAEIPDKEIIKPFLTRDNIVVIPSNNRSFVSRVLPILSSMQDTLFTVYGLSTWSMFENIDIENLNDLNTILPDLDIQRESDFYYNFINKYFLNYYSYPSKYSLEGYKQLLFFCSNKFNNLYDFSLNKSKSNFINSKISLIQYQNYQKVILE